MDLYRANKQQLIAKAQQFSDENSELWESGFELHMLRDAYNPFEYKWLQTKLDTEVALNVNRIHEVNKAMVETQGESLPLILVNNLLDNNTTSKTYNKCIVCGGEIIDGQHIIDHGN